MLARLGSPADALAAWHPYVRRSRARTRQRAAVVAFLAAVASALAVVQLAAGHPPAHDPCPLHAAAPSCEHPAER